MSHASIDIRIRPILWIALFCCSLAINAYGQKDPISPPGNSNQLARTEKDKVIKVGVNEVRLGAVVVDNKGRQITDLSAEDFEIVRSTAEKVDISRAHGLKKIPLRRRLNLENSLTPGYYALQLQVTDKRGKLNTIAYQTLEFEIEENASSPAVSQSPLQKETSIEEKGKTVIEMSEKELRKFDTAFTFLKFNPRQDELASLLEKAGERVVAFFRDFSNTSSKETIKLARTGGRQVIDSITWGLPIMERREENFNYFIMPGTGKAGISWVEDRADKKNNPVNQKAIPGYMMSTGYASLCMYLHPDHQPNSRFRYLGRESKKPYAYVIAFAQKPESGDYLAQYTDMPEPIKIRYMAQGFVTPEPEKIRYAVQGFVWINPDSYQIMRIRTRMLSPEKPGTLKRTMTDVQYDKVRFDDTQREFWLPKTAYIYWEFSNWTYINQHEYSDYHLFSVETEYKIKQPKAEK